MAKLPLLCAAALTARVAGFSSTVSNVKPRVDASGAILDVHDGTTLRVGNTFYFYGASYGGCKEQPSGCSSLDVGACGFNLNHTVSLATSSDLVNWTLVPDVLAVAARPEGIMFSPWVAFSPTTQLYVMWYNMLPVENGHGVFDKAFYAIATSASPLGPFQTVKVNVTGLAFKELPDAASIFVDDDGKGYIAFTHEDSHVNNVQQLTPDLLGPLPGGNVSAVIGGPNNEGVLMFKRNSTYYVGFGQCCCFCKSGSNVELFAAPAPLGPYASLGNIILPEAWGAQTGTVFFTGGLQPPPTAARAPTLSLSQCMHLPPPPFISQALIMSYTETAGRARRTLSKPMIFLTWPRWCGARSGPSLAAGSLPKLRTVQ
jgi:hypothetical protein